MRIRTVKPEFWQSEDLARCSVEARLLAIGLLNIADDEGYLKAHSALIKSQIFPFTEDSMNIQGMLIELSKADYLQLLTGDDGKEYAFIKNFTKHQKVNRPSPSKIKASIEFTESSVNNHEQLTIGKERKGTGKGKEQGTNSSTKVNESVEDVFSYWCQVMGKNENQNKLTTKREKAIKARLKEGYTVEEIKTSIYGCSQDSFSMGHNDRNKPFNDIELICRSGEKLESFWPQQTTTMSVHPGTQRTIKALNIAGGPPDETKRLV